jgi:molybdate-binding protein/DNA-binding XRE family transcriptional regulator
VSRNAIYAIENKSYIPNTAIALKLARLLDISVEELFRLDSGAPATAETAEIMPSDISDTSKVVRPGQPVQACEVNNRLVAVKPAPIVWEIPAVDAVFVETEKRGGRAKIQFFNNKEENRFGKRILIAGCDPGISVLLRHLQWEGVDAISVSRNSTQSLDLLEQAMVHVAGTHLREAATGEANIPIIKERFPEDSVSVVAYAFWEEGLVVAPGNPKSIKLIEDMARKDVKIVNREPGSGMRRKVDLLLSKRGIHTRDVKGYETVALGHLQAAWQVKTGEADCCFATKTAACIFGLDFIPLDRERYDLVIQRRNMDHPGVRVLLDILGRSAFRRELEGLGGYDPRVAGDRLL